MAELLDRQLGHRQQGAAPALKHDFWLQPGQAASGVEFAAEDVARIWQQQPMLGELLEGKPDLVVGFPGGRGTAHVPHRSRSRRRGDRDPVSWLVRVRGTEAVPYGPETDALGVCPTLCPD